MHTYEPEIERLIDKSEQLIIAYRETGLSALTRDQLVAFAHLHNALGEVMRHKYGDDNDTRVR